MKPAWVMRTQKNPGDLFEVIAGIIARLTVKHWSALLVFQLNSCEAESGTGECLECPQSRAGVSGIC